MENATFWTKYRKFTICTLSVFPNDERQKGNQKKLLSPQQVVFRKPADYKL